MESLAIPTNRVLAPRSLLKPFVGGLLSVRQLQDLTYYVRASINGISVSSTAGIPENRK